MSVDYLYNMGIDNKTGKGAPQMMLAASGVEGGRVTQAPWIVTIKAEPYSPQLVLLTGFALGCWPGSFIQEF